MTFIKPFEDLTKNDAEIAGGKGASLGEMTQAGIPVPPGYVVLAQAFDRFLEETDLNTAIAAELAKVNHEDMNSVERASVVITDMIRDVEMPEDIAAEVTAQFEVLGAEYVAVRSSATAEDSSIASWAGELNTYLNVTSDTLLTAVKDCWASLFTPRAIFYRIEKEMHDMHVAVAVVIQTMVQSEISGICFTVHPVTKDYNQMVVEAGLGEAIVGGLVTPDTYIVSKNDGTPVIADKNISEQRMMITRAEGGSTQEVALAGKPEASAQKMSDEQLLEFAQLAMRIEQHYGSPQDIEWAMANDTLYITQSRPITTL